jgi:hypothetical protein
VRFDRSHFNSHSHSCRQVYHWLSRLSSLCRQRQSPARSQALLFTVSAHLDRPAQVRPLAIRRFNLCLRAQFPVGSRYLLFLVSVLWDRSARRIHQRCTAYIQCYRLRVSAPYGRFHPRHRPFSPRQFCPRIRSQRFHTERFLLPHRGSRLFIRAQHQRLLAVLVV